MVEDLYRIVFPDGRFNQPFGIVRGRRHHYLEPGSGHHKAVGTGRVLSRRRPAGTGIGHDGCRESGLSSGHIPRFGERTSYIGQAHTQKLAEHYMHDWPHPRGCRACGCAQHGRFRDSCVQHPFPVFFI